MPKGFRKNGEKLGFQKGNTFSKGIKWSEENKQKTRNRMIGNTISKGRYAWNKGKHYHLLKPMVLEAKIKLSESKRGNKNPAWKGGISLINKRLRHRIEYRLWREAVFARDNWTCQRCQVRGGYLHPHHIKFFASYPELRFAIDNGITLCIKCHYLWHRENAKA